MGIYYTHEILGYAFKFRIDFYTDSGRQCGTTVGRAANEEIVNWCKLNWGRPKSVCLQANLHSSRRWGLSKNWPEKLTFYLKNDEDLVAFMLQFGKHTCIQANQMAA